jgi:hypothetical protein
MQLSANPSMFSLFWQWPVCWIRCRRQAVSIWSNSDPISVVSGGYSGLPRRLPVMVSRRSGFRGWCHDKHAADFPFLSSGCFEATHQMHHCEAYGHRPRAGPVFKSRTRLSALGEKAPITAGHRRRRVDVAVRPREDDSTGRDSRPETMKRKQDGQGLAYIL